MRSPIVIAFAILLLAEPGLTSKCLQYQPSVVTLHGTIQVKAFPGPPNYQSIADGDAPETGWYLQLQDTICLKASARADGIDKAEEDVNEVQLVLKQELYHRYRDMVGKKIAVIGTLFHAHTGHHHAKILIVVKEIRRSP